MKIYSLALFIALMLIPNSSAAQQWNSFDPSLPSTEFAPDSNVPPQIAFELVRRFDTLLSESIRANGRHIKDIGFSIDGTLFAQGEALFWIGRLKRSTGLSKLGPYRVGTISRFDFYAIDRIGVDLNRAVASNSLRGVEEILVGCSDTLTGDLRGVDVEELLFLISDRLSDELGIKSRVQLMCDVIPASSRAYIELQVENARNKYFPATVSVRIPGAGLRSNAGFFYIPTRESTKIIFEASVFVSERVGSELFGRSGIESTYDFANLPPGSPSSDLSTKLDYYYAMHNARLDSLSDAFLSVLLVDFPSEPKVVIAKGDRLFDGGEYRSALDSYLEAAELDGDFVFNDSETLERLSTASLFEGNYTDAIRWARRTTELSPAWPSGYRALGRALRAQAWDLREKTGENMSSQLFSQAFDAFREMEEISAWGNGVASNDVESTIRMILNSTPIFMGNQEDSAESRALLQSAVEAVQIIKDDDVSRAVFRARLSLRLATLMLPSGSETLAQAHKEFSHAVSLRDSASNVASLVDGDCTGDVDSSLSFPLLDFELAEVQVALGNYQAASDSARKGLKVIDCSREYTSTGFKSLVAVFDAFRDIDKRSESELLDQLSTDLATSGGIPTLRSKRWPGTATWRFALLEPHLCFGERSTDRDIVVKLYESMYVSLDMSDSLGSQGICLKWLKLAEGTVDE